MPRYAGPRRDRSRDGADIPSGRIGRRARSSAARVTGSALCCSATAVRQRRPTPPAKAVTLSGDASCCRRRRVECSPKFARPRPRCAADRRPSAGVPGARCARTRCATRAARPPPRALNRHRGGGGPVLAVLFRSADPRPRRRSTALKPTTRTSSTASRPRRRWRGGRSRSAPAVAGRVGIAQPTSRPRQSAASSSCRRCTVGAVFHYNLTKGFRARLRNAIGHRPANRPPN